MTQGFQGNSKVKQESPARNGIIWFEYKKRERERKKENLFL